MDNKEGAPALQPVPIWRCRNKECRSWIRAELTQEKDPACPLCGGPMGRSMRHLPKLVKKIKTPRKPAEQQP